MNQDKDNSIEQPTPAGKVSVPSVKSQDIFSSNVMLNSPEDEVFTGDLSFLRI